MHKNKTNCLRSGLGIQHDKCKCEMCGKLRKTEFKPKANNEVKDGNN